MHVVGHGAAVQPLLGAARALGAFRVQQYQDLGGLGKRGAAQQAVFFNRVDGGLGLRVGTLEVIATRWATLGAIAATDLKALA